MKRTFLALVLVITPLIWLFRSALFRTETFVFRDAAHYYYPLFRYVNSQWAQGHVPLWNPLEETGRPLLADPTACVLYPGKLLFLLPLDFAQNWNLYVFVHLLLAATSVYFVARRWGATRNGAALGAITYSLGGQVLFQYCNVVFLVGAAWLPLSAFAVERTLVRRSWRSAILFGVSLSLMVLGGDAQMAYHMGLVGCVYAGLLWRQVRHEQRVGRTGQRPIADRRDARMGLARHRPALLALAGLAGLLLSAGQVLPTVEWSRRSDRAVYDQPRSVLELVARTRGWNETVSGLLNLSRRPAAGTHHEKAFEFSVAPWRLIELLWPNVSGRQFPVHRRWFNGIPAEGRIWTPTLYMGCIPLIAALAGLNLRRADSPRVQWLSWIAVLSIVSSFGAYGLGWLANEVRFALRPDGFQQAEFAPSFGGLYWLMTTTLPGYVQFRYPAKLWTLAALAISLLAAVGWQPLWSRPQPRLARFLARLAITGGALSLIVLVTPAVQPALLTWIEAKVPADSLFGPIDARGAAHDISRSLMHTATVCGIFAWLLNRVMHAALSDTRREPRFLAAVAVTITAVELTIAQSWLVPTAPAGQWKGESLFAGCIAKSVEQVGPTTGPARFYRYASRGWQPKAWSQTSSPRRQQDGQRWEHDTLYPKYHLLHKVGAIETTGPFSSADFRAVMDAAREYGPARGDGQREPHQVVLDSLGIGYVIGPREWVADESAWVVGEIPSASRSGVGEAGCFRNFSAYPRAWIVHNWKSRAPLPSGASLREFGQATSEVFFPGGRPRNLREAALVEGHLPNPPADRGTTDSEACQIVHEGPTHVEISARLARPGLVVLSDAVAPGWRCYAVSSEGHEERRVDLLRVNRIMRGVYLPAGEFRIVHRYEPWWVKVGLSISVASWIGLACWTIARRF